MNKILAIIGLCTLFLPSCEKSDNCEDQQYELFSLESEYDCVNTKYQLEIDLNNGHTTIRDQEEFENLVGGSCDVLIDFERFDLIIGKHGLSNGNVKIEYDLIQLCDVVAPQLMVTFFQNFTDIAPNLTYHVLVDKLQEGQNVQVSIFEKFE